MEKDLINIQIITGFYLTTSSDEIIELYNILKKDFCYGKRMKKSFFVIISHENIIRYVLFGSKNNIISDRSIISQQKSYSIIFENEITHRKKYCLKIDIRSVYYTRELINSFHHRSKNLTIESIVRKIKIKKILKLK